MGDKNDEENPWNKEVVAHNAAVLDEPPEVSMADHLKALTNVDKRGDNEGDDVFFYPIEHNLNDLFWLFIISMEYTFLRTYIISTLKIIIS